MASINEVITPAWEELSMGLLISDVRPVYEYENQKKTDKLLGYKGTFLLTEGVGRGLQIDVKVSLIDEPSWELMKHYEFEFDKEKSKVYVSGRNMALSLWAKSVTEV